MASRDWAKAMNKAVFPGIQGGPLMHVIAAKAVAFGEARPLVPNNTAANRSKNRRVEFRVSLAPPAKE